MSQSGSYNQAMNDTTAGRTRPATTSIFLHKLCKLRFAGVKEIMTKIVINKCFGGFGLSHKAMMRYAELKGITLYPYIDDISKSVYKERATLDNPEMLIHYTTKPLSKHHTDGELNDCYFSDYDIKRDDPLLVQVVEELGIAANTPHAKLSIVSIPDGVDWEIEEYDGSESIHEVHRSWG